MPCSLFSRASELNVSLFGRDVVFPMFFREL